VLLVADSDNVFALRNGDRVEVYRSEHTTRIVRLRPASFYHKIRRRLLWGERLNG